MGQDVIWDYFQNEGVESFNGARPRLEFLVRRLNRNERMLNIGVGSGELERLAAKKGVEVWALDPSARSIERLRDEVQLGERAQVGYSQDIPFPDNHFDSVVMTEVLEHLEADIRDRTLPEISRVLRPGGRFLGTVPASERLEDNHVVCPHCGHGFHRWGHQARYDGSALRRLLEQVFAVERIEEHFFNEWDSAGWGRRLTGLLKKFLSWRRLGTYGQARNLFFVARKRP